MSLLHARGVALRYGPKVLLEDASFTLGHRDRGGLIGPNGSAKSTLMKVLCGRIEPDAGSVQLVRRARAAYLPQESPLIDSKTSSIRWSTLAGGTGLACAIVSRRRCFSRRAAEITEPQPLGV